MDPRVLEEMLPYFTVHYGNASSKTHSFGWVADEAVKIAREKVAALIGARPDEITFTSGATEAINLGIKGYVESNRSGRRKIIVSAAEHKAVLDTCTHLQKVGAEITVLPVGPDGLVEPAVLASILDEHTLLVCIMLANNETGVVQPIRTLSDLTHEKGAVFFSDTTQAAGKIPFDVMKTGVDMCCLSAHKFYGPKGTGALFARKNHPRIKLTAQADGGGHENGLRSGTLNVPGIAGMGKAAELAAAECNSAGEKISGLRDLLENSLVNTGKVFPNGNILQRLPNTSNLRFRDIRASSLIPVFPWIAMATGSACTSALPEPSHVLRAMGLSTEEAWSSIRFSFGRFNTMEETERVAGAFRDFLGKQ